MGSRIVSALGLKHVVVHVLECCILSPDGKTVTRPCSIKFHLQAGDKKTKAGKCSTTHLRPSSANTCSWNETLRLPLAALSQSLHIRVCVHHMLSKTVICELVMSISDGLNLKLHEFFDCPLENNESNEYHKLNRRRSWDNFVVGREGRGSIPVGAGSGDDSAWQVDDTLWSAMTVTRPVQPSVGSHIGIQEEIINELDLSDSVWINRSAQHSHALGKIRLGMRLE
jgi:hypothetical protein